MQIVFLHIGPVLHGRDLDTKPLGGTETALLAMAYALARHNNIKVHVFTNVESAHEFDGVSFLPLNQLGRFAQQVEIDVFISIRQWLPFWLPMRTRLRIYFSPDAFDQPFLHYGLKVSLLLQGRVAELGLFPPSLFFNNIHEIFCVGQWQANSFIEKLKFPPEKIFVTANGLLPSRYQPLPLSKRQPALIYSSTPFRGLEYLVDYFNEIKIKIPSAELWSYSGMGVYGVSTEQNENQFGALYKKILQVGGCSFGSVPQQELAKAMCRARVFAYPNIFDETFCISVLEAQASGLPVVTSARAALLERVEHGVDGFLIEGHPQESDYRVKFVNACQRLLTDDTLWQSMSEKAQTKAKEYTYQNLANNWLGRFNKQTQATKPQIGAPPLFWPTTRIRLEKDQSIQEVAGEQLKSLYHEYAQQFGF